VGKASRCASSALDHLIPRYGQALCGGDPLIAAQVQIANGRLPERHRVRSFRIIPRPLRSGDEELTPAMRLNRWVVARRYADLLDAA